MLDGSGGFYGGGNFYGGSVPVAAPLPVTMHDLGTLTLRSGRLAGPVFSGNLGRLVKHSGNLDTGGSD